MNNYYYIPINSLNYNNLLSTESVSPPAFYEKRGYGFKRFEELTCNPFKFSLLAYSKLPILELGPSNREEFPFYIAIPENRLPEQKKENQLDSVRILQILSPIYLNIKECFLVARNDLERRKLIVTSERSLEVKHTGLYEKKIKLIEELGIDQVIKWNSKFINDITDPQAFPYPELEKDQVLNKARGILYGLTCGSLMQQPKELSALSNLWQEFINVFSGLMNDLSVMARASSKQSIDHKKARQEMDQLEELKEKIQTLLSGFDVIHLDEIIMDSFSLNLTELEQLRSKRYKGGQVTIYSMLADFVKGRDEKALGVGDYVVLLTNKVKEFLKYKSASLYLSLEDDFNLAISRVNKKLTELSQMATTSDPITHIPIVFSKDLQAITSQIPLLSEWENNCYQAITTELLKLKEMSTADELGQKRSELITSVAKSLEKTHPKFDGSDDQEYLRKLWKSLRTVGVGFKVNETPNQSLRAFACFMSKHAELDKLKTFMLKNEFDRYDLVFGIWGAAYGYAGLSKLILEPLYLKRGVLEIILQESAKLAGHNDLEGDDSVMTPTKPANVPSNYIEWELTSPSPVNQMKEPTIDYNVTGKDRFEQLIRENAKLRKHEDWVQAILKSYNQVMSKQEKKLFIDVVSAFKEQLKNLGANLKGFGSDKVKEAIKVFEQYQNSNE